MKPIIQTPEGKKHTRERGGNQTRAAEKLGITRRMLQYKMKKYEIKAKRFLDRQ